MGFERWVNSDEYTGPDMTDFGLDLKDPEFKSNILHKNCFAMILDDEIFAKKLG